MEGIIHVKSLAEEMRERRREKERAREYAGMNLLTPAEAAALSRYFSWVRDEKEPSRDSFPVVADKFLMATGKSLETASPLVRKVILSLYGMLADGKDRKGFYIMGGTGCGKTTIANVLSGVGNYRVVNCIDIARDYSVEGDSGLDRYMSGNLCLDDLGSEEKAYGKEILGMVIQKRYELWRSALTRVGVAVREVEGLEAYGREKGYDRVDYGSLRSTDDGFEEKVTWKFDLRDARARVGRLAGDVPVTHVTSNLSIGQHAVRYSDRVSSRLYEMCHFVDMGSEKDYRA